MPAAVQGPGHPLRGSNPARFNLVLYSSPSLSRAALTYVTTCSADVACVGRVPLSACTFAQL
eukprot:10406329-Alexandrium_andersonii.AAC.1